MSETTDFYALPDHVPEIDPRDALIADQSAALALAKGALSKLVEAVDDLIADSAGVSGLHLNGDFAPWSELTAGGQFEDWLLPLEHAHQALAAIAKVAGTGGEVQS